MDIALEWEAKWSVSTSAEQFQALRDKRVAAAEAKGKQLSSWFDRAEWYRREVWLQLKAKTRGLSLHEMSDFVGMKKDDRFAYQVLLADASKVAEQLTKQKAGK